ASPGRMARAGTTAAGDGATADGTTAGGYATGGRGGAGGAAGGGAGTACDGEIWSGGGAAAAGPRDSTNRASRLRAASFGPRNTQPGSWAGHSGPGGCGSGSRTLRRPRPGIRARRRRG